MDLSFSTYPALGWNWEPSVLLGLALLTGIYWMIVGPLRLRHAPQEVLSTPRQLAFHTGTLLVFLALASPLDTLADGYLFSAHMVQHLVLTYVAPPLWLLGLPVWVPERLTRPGATRWLIAVLIQPVTAFVVFNATMWAWHIPSVYDTALAHENLHILEHLAFMTGAVIGWWPILGPSPRELQRLSPLLRGLYLFLSTLACTGLAALITLSARRLYAFYGENPLLWGLSPLLDQQLGGLLMWLPVDILLMSVTLVILYRWLNDSSHHPGNFNRPAHEMEK